MAFIDDVMFDDKGLVPCIVQDDTTKEVLMMAYMNKESHPQEYTSDFQWLLPCFHRSVKIRIHNP